MESLTPEIFDLLVIINIVIGVSWAGRRFIRDLRGPLHEDAPDWARAAQQTPAAGRAPSDSS
jgi:hypothetical protein